MLTEEHRKEECGHYLEYKKRIDKALSEMDEISLQKSVVKTPSQYRELVNMCKMPEDEAKLLSSTDHHRYKLLRSAKRVYFVEELAGGECALFRTQYGYERKKRSDGNPRHGNRVYDVYEAFYVMRTIHLALRHKVGATKARIRDTTACVTAWMVQIFIDTCPLCASRPAKPLGEQHRRKRRRESSSFGERCRARLVGLRPAFVDGVAHESACIVVECSTGAPLAVRPVRTRSFADLASCIADALAVIGDCAVLLIEESQQFRDNLANALDERLVNIPKATSQGHRRRIVARPPEKGDETAADTLDDIAAMLLAVDGEASWPRSCASIHCTILNSPRNNHHQRPFLREDDDEDDFSNSTYRNVLFPRHSAPGSLVAGGSSPEDVVVDSSGRLVLFESSVSTPLDER